MKEILLALVCQEFDIEEGLMLSRSRHDIIQNSLSMCTYILVTHYKKSIIEVHDFYKTKGFTKQREVLYNQIKRAHKNIRQYDAYRERQSSLIEGVEIALAQGIVIPTEADIHAMKGRIVSKMMALRDHANLTKMENQIDTYIKSEFVNTGQYGKKEKETWLT
jgi:hypothetical protein